jgi:hypothetical protein
MLNARRYSARRYSASRARILAALLDELPEGVVLERVGPGDWPEYPVPDDELPAFARWDDAVGGALADWAALGIDFDAELPPELLRGPGRDGRAWEVDWRDDEGRACLSSDADLARALLAAKNRIRLARARRAP